MAYCRYSANNRVNIVINIIHHAEMDDISFFKSMVVKLKAQSGGANKQFDLARDDHLYIGLSIITGYSPLEVIIF